MLPVLALVGRPNVGKSTLFNALTGTRDALVADYPGLTRDRLYGYASGHRAILIDTGGLAGGDDPIAALIQAQVGLAIGEADVVLMVVDAREGPLPDDHLVAGMLRRAGKPVLLAVNKAEGLEAATVAAMFYELGMGEPMAVSALRRDGMGRLLESALELAPSSTASGQGADGAEAPAGGMRVAVAGRPNVGKSTLINRYLGEERLLTMDEPGTTRDSISIPFSHAGHDYILIDTAGIRRRARSTGMVEKFSIVKSLQAIEEADAVILLLDARTGLTEQDVSLAGLVVERGRALTLGINKWDGLPPDARTRFRDDLDRRLPFLEFAEHHYVSALHGTSIFDLLASARRAGEAALRDLSTPDLNRALQAAVTAHSPPMVNRRRVKLSYAHQGGKRPPLIVIHGNQTEKLPQTYRRYLINCFRKAFRLKGTPIRLELRTGKNPFAGRRNPLTPRQIKRRQRIQRR
jgi:GTP-binding protein